MIMVITTHLTVNSGANQGIATYVHRKGEIPCMINAYIIPQQLSRRARGSLQSRSL